MKHLEPLKKQTSTLNIVDKIRKAALTNAIQRQTLDAKFWFSEKLRDLFSYNRQRLLTDHNFKQRNTPLIGRMYMFVYDPKLKEVLPFYDKFPLIIMMGPAPGGFYGLNLHYLHPIHRAIFLDLIMGNLNNTVMNETTKTLFTYELLKRTQRMRYFKPTFKHYLTDHIKSRISLVMPEDWEIVAFLETANWQKANRYAVWNDSRNKIFRH